MKITLNEAMTVMGIRTMPITEEVLELLYRKQRSEAHPDKGGTKERFHEIKVAYNVICNEGVILKRNGINSVGNAEHLPSHTVDGTPISELGKGIGTTKNGVPCTHCRGEGYSKFEDTYLEVVVCSSCDGSGKVPKTFDCRDCKGTGKFTTARTKREVECRRCKGTGKWIHPTFVRRCWTCKGTGQVWGERIAHITFHVCWRCTGKGETEIFNPVLPKGLLAGTRR